MRFGRGRSRPRPLPFGAEVLPGRSRKGLALPLFPAPQEGPPVADEPAACLPVPGLAPVEEAPGVYAVAALPAVQLHFSEGRRPETVRHGLTQGCGIISRFRKGRTLHGFGAGLPGIREFRALLRPALRRQKLRQSRFGTLRKKARRERRNRGNCRERCSFHLARLLCGERCAFRLDCRACRGCRV